MQLTESTQLDDRIIDCIKARIMEIISEESKIGNSQIERVHGQKVCYQSYYFSETGWCGEFWGCIAHVEKNNILITIRIADGKPFILEVFSKYKKSPVYKGRRGHYFEYDCTLKNRILERDI